MMISGNLYYRKINEKYASFILASRFQEVDFKIGELLGKKGGKGIEYQRGGLWV